MEIGRGYRRGEGRSVEEIPEGGDEVRGMEMSRP